MKIIDLSENMREYLVFNGYQNVRPCIFSIIDTLFSKIIYDEYTDLLYIEPTSHREKLFKLNVFTEKCFCDTLSFLTDELKFINISKNEKRYYLTNKARINLIGEIK